MPLPALSGGWVLPPSSAPQDIDLEESSRVRVGGGRGSRKLGSQWIPPQEAESG